MRFLDVRMDVASFCNLKCIMCYLTYADNPRQLMNLDLFRKIAGEVFPKTRILNLSWATEPLVNKHLPEMLEVAKKEYGVPLTIITTNAVGLHPRVCEALVSGILDKLYISIDGATKETYEGIRINADFDRVISNLEYLHNLKTERGAKKPGIVFNYALMNRNIEELPDFVGLAARLGGREINAFPIKMQNEYLDLVKLSEQGVISEEQKRAIEGLNLQEELISLDSPRVAEAISEAEKQARKKGVYLYAPRVKKGKTAHISWLLRRLYGKLINIPLVPMLSFGSHMAFIALRHRRAICLEPWHRLVIYTDGTVQPCCSWQDEVLGSLQSQSFEEIWQGEGFAGLRKALETGCPPAQCANCPSSTRAILSG